MFIFILVATLDNDEDEFSSAGIFIGEDLDYLTLLKTGDKPGQRQAILMLAVILLIIIYHACFTSEVFPKTGLSKLFLVVAITTIFYKNYYYASS